MGFTDRKKGRRVTNMELNKTNQERDNMENCCKEETPYWRIGETEACFVEVGDVITVEETCFTVRSVQNYKSWRKTTDPIEDMVRIKGRSGYNNYDFKLNLVDLVEIH